MCLESHAEPVEVLVSRESAQPSIDRVPGEVVLAGFHSQSDEAVDGLFDDMAWMSTIVSSLQQNS